MCGIVGFNMNDTSKLESMLASIHHRGPDDRGIFEDDKCSLGHVRLSILDLSSHGHQPMRYEHLTLVYNGEVYNYREIREELIEIGYSFDSDSDTEVILKAYHNWGIKYSNVVYLCNIYSIICKRIRRIPFTRFTSKINMVKCRVSRNFNNIFLYNAKFLWK